LKGAQGSLFQGAHRPGDTMRRVKAASGASKTKSKPVTPQAQPVDFDQLCDQAFEVRDSHTKLWNCFKLI
jgi:hypothetical protein